MSKITEKREVEQVVGYVCDICCKECPHGEHATLHAQWGFDSSKDGEVHECHMCEVCYDQIKVLINQRGGNVRKQSYDLLNGDILGEL